MLARLQEGLVFLVQGARDLPVRHRTLRGAIAWSHDLLGEGERRLFARLAVFDGSFDVEAADAVCAAAGSPVLDGLESLAAQSLLRHDVAADGEPRFWMLQTIREFAREQLRLRGEADAVCARHAAYHLRLAETAEPECAAASRAAGRSGSRRRRPISRQRCAGSTRVANGRRAGSWPARCTCSGTGAATTRRAASSSSRCSAPGSSPGGPPSVARAKALHGRPRWRRGATPNAARLRYLESLSIRRALGDRGGVASTLNNLGNLARYQGEYATAQQHYAEALELVQDRADDWGTAIVLNNLGILARVRGELPDALRLAGESLAIARRTADLRNQALAMATLGDAHRDAGHPVPGQTHLEAALASFRALGDRDSAADVLNELGTAARDAGRLDDAGRLYREESGRPAGHRHPTRRRGGAGERGRLVGGGGRPRGRRTPRWRKRCRCWGSSSSSGSWRPR